MYTKKETFAETSPVLDNFLKTFVPNCKYVYIKESVHSCLLTLVREMVVNSNFRLVVDLTSGYSWVSLRGRDIFSILHKAHFPVSTTQEVLSMNFLK